jgi:hypothetical protein
MTATATIANAGLEPAYQDIRRDRGGKESRRRPRATLDEMKSKVADQLALAGTPVNF